MRAAFIKTLSELAEHDQRILLLTGDLGYLVLETFINKFPDRFFNMGVAEQNMVGVATGLAEAGFIPFVYTMAPFAALRPYEFIRNGPVRHHFPVRIVGVGGGLDYGNAGFTHYGLEDMGVMRMQPGLTLIAPADSDQTRNALLESWNLSGPIYYRLGKDEKSVIPELEGRFKLSRNNILGNGSDLLFVTMGGITSEVVEAVKILKDQGVQSTVIVVSTLSPAPIADLLEVLMHFKLVFTVESHYVTGGLGSLVSEVVAESGLNCRIVRSGARWGPDGHSGSMEYMHDIYQLSRKSLVEIVGRELDRI